jgi:hypothetical protein
MTPPMRLHGVVLSSMRTTLPYVRKEAAEIKRDETVKSFKRFTCLLQLDVLTENFGYSSLIYS